MQEFNYHAPKTVADAVTALKGAEDGKFLAGGQSLIPVLRLDMAAPSDLISLREIPELTAIRMDGDTLVIGALATHRAVEESDVVRQAIPALSEMAGHIGDPQVRNRGTLGGSVAHADPAADYPAALLGLSATVETDRRKIAADDFFTGLFTTALAEDELIVAIHFPRAEKARYAKFASPASKYAIAGVFVAKTADGVRVAVTGAGSKAFRSEAMEKALASDWSASAIEGISVPAAELRSDLEASAEYRSHLIGVMARRAVASA
ncbi:MAG: xanthine dehydrogenase family protein subunit M [Myxococcota bacterium]